MAGEASGLSFARRSNIVERKDDDLRVFTLRYFRFV